MADNSDKSKSRLKGFIWKALKATVKATIVYAIYFFLMSFLEPVSSYIPSLRLMIEAFVAVYIILMIIGDLCSGTIFQYFFNTARSLFVVCYMILSLQGGIIGVAFQNVNLLIDLRMVLVIAMILGLLGLAKSMLQAIDYMNQRAELALI